MNAPTPSADRPIRLTEYAACAGCASKMGPEALSEALAPLASMFAPENFPNLLRGLEQPDDAAVWRLNDQQTLIVTTDFFAPIVDDPIDYGAIAATNALSDVYAMGGTPILALNLAAFPESFSPDLVSNILRGGAEAVRVAGAVIAGGHTIVDPEPKYGLAVVGLGAPDQLFPKGGARPGDVLYLTKPIGTGVITTAHKRGAASADALAEAVASMKRLNAGAAAALREHAGAIGAATDVTGFSLAGHAYQVASGSDCALEISWDSVPLLPNAHALAQPAHVTGGGRRNQDYYGAWVENRRDLSAEESALLFDPQTSGGLMFSVRSSAASGLEQSFKASREPFWRIGDVRDAPAGRVVIV